jgi:hypothetical protein
VYAEAIVTCAAILSVIAWAAAFHPACSTPATATTASTSTEMPVACSGAAKFTSDTQGSLPPVAVRPMTLGNSRTVSPLGFCPLGVDGDASQPGPLYWRPAR